MYGLGNCIGGWLHHFEIERDTTEYVEERCEICGKGVIHQIVDGRIDNNRYAQYNARLFLQPGTPQFIHEYRS